MMIDYYLRLGLAPGGHRDDSSNGGEIVGCGAIDGMDSILTNMTDPALVEDHKRLVKALLDKEFDREHYLRGLGITKPLARVLCWPRRDTRPTRKEGAKKRVGFERSSSRGIGDC